MTLSIDQPTLTGQCTAEFLGTALMIFFGTGCVAALKVGEYHPGAAKLYREKGLLK